MMQGVAIFCKLLKKCSFKVGRPTPELNVQIVATRRSDFFTPKLEIRKSALELTKPAFLSYKQEA
jgi:hypothetical protein